MEGESRGENPSFRTQKSMAELKSAEGDDEFSWKPKVDRSTSLVRIPEEEADPGNKRKMETLAEKNGSVPPDAGESLEKPEEAASGKRRKIDENNGSLPLEEYHLRGGDALVEENDDDNEEEEEDDDDDEEDYSVEQDKDEDEVKRRADVKGKGIAVDRKGKGKMVDSEDEDSDSQNDDDDDDDSSDDSDGNSSDGLDDSDAEDDPLAEVDLNNILPSRTRRCKPQAGFRINDKSEDA